LIELPFGLLGGWLLGRNAATPVANALSDRQPLIERRWQDLRKWRLLFAMILAAAVPIVLFAILSILSFGPISDQYFSAAGFGSALIIFEFWFLAFGIPYLFFVRSRRGTVRRRDCLFLGSLVYCCFPVFLVTLQGRFGLPAASWIDAQTGVAGVILLSAVLGFIFLPFGLLSGWILWRVGVRPAKPEEIGVAPVFD
jgi:hypothetical protein